MNLQINNDEQLYELGVLAHRLDSLKTAIKGYNCVLDHKEHYEKTYKIPEVATKYYRKDLETTKSGIEVEVNFVNACLLSLGMETITIEY